MRYHMDRKMNNIENIVKESKFESNPIHHESKGNSDQLLLTRLTHEFFESQRQINKLLLEKIKSLEEKIANIETAGERITNG